MSALPIVYYVRGQSLENGQFLSANESTNRFLSWQLWPWRQVADLDSRRRVPQLSAANRPKTNDLFVNINTNDP